MSSERAAELFLAAAIVLSSRDVSRRPTSTRLSRVVMRLKPAGEDHEVGYGTSVGYGRYATYMSATVASVTRTGKNKYSSKRGENNPEVRSSEKPK